MLDSRNDFGIDELLIDGVRHSLVSWEVVSLDTSQRVFIFEWRNPRVVIGRAHVFAPKSQGDPYSLREFFVGPRRRRKAHGAFLEGAVADYVIELGGESLVVWMHKADLLPRCSPAAEGFAMARGYAPTDQAPPRGDITAVWRKELR